MSGLKIRLTKPLGSQFKSIAFPIELADQISCIYDGVVNRIAIAPTPHNSVGHSHAPWKKAAHQNP
jgi:hypothetical protein